MIQGGMRVLTRPGPRLDLSHGLLLYLSLLLWTRGVSGLTDFSNYLSRIISSHSAHACDGQPLQLRCPRHSTISIQSAFYGRGQAWLCPPHPQPPGGRNHSCSAFTALQKLLSECQSHTDCQLPVNHLLFGRDPCPGTSKYLHVDYKCKPAEHRRRVWCEGATMELSCEPPRVLNIYAAVYGRGLGHGDTCPPHRRDRPHPPFECLNHEAVHSVSKLCYSKQSCSVAVGDQTFRDPCFPGTRKYLSVIYSCVPESLLREADPRAFASAEPHTVPAVDILAKGSIKPVQSVAIMSNSLLTYAYIREHPEMAALLFTSSVCLGLLLTLLAVSMRVTCRGRRPRGRSLTGQDGDEEEEEEEEEEDETESSLISERRAACDWEEVTYVSEAAERAERIERRDMVMQEIWMNAYLNGSSPPPLNLPGNNDYG